MFKSCMILILSGAMVGNAIADSPLMFSSKGQSQTILWASRGDSLIEKAEGPSLHEAIGSQVVDLNTELRGRVVEAERLLRASPPAEADPADQSVFVTEINRKIHNLVVDLPGQAVDVGFLIVNVIEREPPNPPGPLRGDAGESERERYRIALKSYEEELCRFHERQFFIIGRLPWAQPVLDTPREIRAATQGATAEWRTKLMNGWREQRPAHFIYFTADQRTAEHWKPGQLHRIRGRIETAGLYWYRPTITSAKWAEKDCTYAQFECVVYPHEIDPAIEGGASDSAGERVE